MFLVFLLLNSIDFVDSMNRALLLIQGGLGNQLLQLCLASSWCIDNSIPLSVDVSLFSSRSRYLRGVTRREISPLVEALCSTVSLNNSIIPRVAFRLGCFSDELYDGALSKVSTFWGPFLKGDGVSRLAFDPRHSPFWSRVVHFLFLFCWPAGMECKFDIVAHVRGTDFASGRVLSRTGLYPMSLSYYISAIDLAASRLNSFDPSILIVTDAPEFVREQLIPILRYTNIVVSSASPQLDMLHLICAPVMIISNSSFSALSAHLSAVAGYSASVICPRFWFHPSYSGSCRGDLRSNTWIHI